MKRSSGQNVWTAWPVTTIYPPAENVNETPDKYTEILTIISQSITKYHLPVDDVNLGNWNGQLF